MEIKVSVILPVYNVADYLHECIDSIINQTLKEIEIICVDDGSTDSSLDILYTYKEKDDRIIILTQKNQYAGIARNAGIKIARGEYLAFLDSDDFFEPTFLEKVYNQGKRKDADVVLFSAKKFNHQTKEYMKAPNYFKKDYIPKKSVFNRTDCPDRLLSITTTAPWTKLFKREFVLREKIEFQGLKNSNDVYFVLIALTLAKRITYVDECFVYYRIGLSTNLQSTKSKDPTCFVDAYLAVYDTLIYKGVYKEVEQSFINSFMFAIRYNISTISDYSALQKVYEVLYDERILKMDLLNHSQNYYLRKKDYLETACALNISNFMHKKMQLSEFLIIHEDNKAIEQKEISVILDVCSLKDINKVLEKLNNFENLEIVCLVKDNVTKIKGTYSKVILMNDFNLYHIPAMDLNGQYIYYITDDNEIENLRNSLDCINQKDCELLYFDSNCHKSSSVNREKALEYFTGNDFSLSSWIYKKDSLVQIIKNTYCSLENYSYLLLLILNSAIIYHTDGYIKEKFISKSNTFDQSYFDFKIVYDLIKNLDFITECSMYEKQSFYLIIKAHLNNARIYYSRLKYNEKQLYKGLSFDEFSLYEMFIVNYYYEQEEKETKKSLIHKLKRRIKKYYNKCKNILK